MEVIERETIKDNQGRTKVKDVYYDEEEEQVTKIGLNLKVKCY